MNLFIYTGASRLNAAVVESATDLTPVSRLPDLIVGDSEPVTVKFLSASGAYESWSGGGTYTLSISIGALGGDGIAAYFQTSSFTAVTNGWTGRLNLASGSLPSVVAGYLADRPGAQSVPLFVQVRVTDADGNTETYARQAVSISGAVSVPTTANSTPVTYATAADVAADASTASAAAIAAAASASAAAGSASTAAGHVTTAGNSATAAAASAVTAGNSATTASGHATTATTQATNAATSASSASTYKDAAAVSAASATSSAGTATTQAALATTNGAAQVTLAAAQVTLATTQATNAGTSASAAAVSAAAALVSEAAALVSKNAAAASAATASAVSGSGNGTFSSAALTGVASVQAASSAGLALKNVSGTTVATFGPGGGSGVAFAASGFTGVNSVTADTSAALTLTGGSSGASLVLGHTAGASMSSTSKLNLSNTTPASSSTVGALTIGNGTAATNVAIGGGNVNAGGTGTFANSIVASGTASNQFLISSANAGQIRAVGLQTAGVSRWLLYANTTAESGSNSGSNLQLAAYDDAGNAIDSPISIARVAGGTMTLSRPTSLTNATASSGVGTGALQVVGGIYAGAASVFGGAATFAGAVTANGQLIAKGTATNDNAATGYIGEYPTPAVVLVGSAITLTTNTDANVTSISLTAGDWDVTGTAVFTGGAITGTRSTAGVSTVSATLNSSTPLLYAQSPSVPTTNADVTVSVPNVRISISSTTTVYLVSNSSFSAGTAKAYGCLQARRVR